MVYGCRVVPVGIDAITAISCVPRRSIAQCSVGCITQTVLLFTRHRHSRPFVDVCHVEIVCEKNHVAEVHGRGQHKVRDVHVTRTASVHFVVRVHVDVQADEHLRKLERGDADVDGARQPHQPGRHYAVVRVHDGVHEQVDGGEHAPWPDGIHQAVPAEPQHGDVVVPVQEDQLLFLQHHKHRVTKLKHLGQGEQKRPRANVIKILARADHVRPAALLDV